MTKVGVVAMLCLAACSRGAPPTCEQAVTAATAHLHLDSPLDVFHAEPLEKLQPFDARYTGSDTAFLVAECIDDRWSDDYRRCASAIASDGDLAACGRDGQPLAPNWSWVPHVQAWMSRFVDMAQDAEDLARIAADGARSD